MTTYNIYINSNEHPRTINTPRNGRCYYTKLVAHGKEELTAKVAELKANGKTISEVRTNLGTRIM